MSWRWWPRPTGVGSSAGDIPLEPPTFRLANSASAAECPPGAGGFDAGHSRNAEVRQLATASSPELSRSVQRANGTSRPRRSDMKRGRGTTSSGAVATCPRSRRAPRGRALSMAIWAVLAEARALLARDERGRNGSEDLPVPVPPTGQCGATLWSCAAKAESLPKGVCSGGPDFGLGAARRRLSTWDRRRLPWGH